MKGGEEEEEEGREKREKQWLTEPEPGKCWERGGGEERINDTKLQLAEGDLLTMMCCIFQNSWKRVYISLQNIISA